MNWSKIFTIYKKELIDIFRDKRTVITSIIIPLILYPILIVGVNSLMSRQTKKLKDEKSSIYVQDELNNNNSKQIVNFLEKNESLIIKDNLENAEEKLKDKKINAIVTIKDSTLSNYTLYKVTVSYDNSDDKSKIAYSTIKNSLEKVKENFLESRLNDKKINLEILETIEISKENIAPPEKMLGFLVGKILPYLLIILTISGGSVASSDLVAGEKERGTLETILISAASRTELVLGKYLTIITISMITVVLNLFSVFVSLKHVLNQSGVNMTSLSLPISKFGLILLAMIPIASLFSAILITISTYSRNMKETKSFESPLIVIAMMLSMISFFPGFELTFGLAFIPVINISLLFKDIMMNEMNIYHFLTVIGSTLILDIISLKISISMFKKETILFRTSNEEVSKKPIWKKLKNFDPFATNIALILYVFVLLSMFYFASALQSKNLFKGLLLTQLIFILLPPLVVMIKSKVNWQKEIKLLNIPEFKPTLLVLAATLPIVTISSYLTAIINRFFPVSEAYMKMFEKLLSGNEISFWQTIFIVGILPGICEEFLFRGYMYRSLRKYGKWMAILVTAFLFTALHLDLFRAIPIFVIAIWLGYIFETSRTLILPIIAHILNNSMAVIFSQFGNKSAIIKDFILEPNLLQVSIAIAVFGIIIFYFKSSHKDRKRI